MKKFISIIMSLVMAVSLCAVSVVPAMAATVVSPQETTKQVVINVQVNGSTSDDVVYERDPEDENEITFTYNGDGELTGWEFPGMEEGVDYEIVSEDGNSITIRLLNDYDGEVTANAIVDLDEDEESDTTTTKSSSTSTNSSSTSPDTGAVVGTGIAVAGAGVAILAALKKKDSDAE